ncbi:MAG TPA: hypothetical protein VGO62_13205, partial [Myxococcota bacterium]
MRILRYTRGTHRTQTLGGATLRPVPLSSARMGAVVAACLIPAALAVTVLVTRPRPVPKAATLALALPTPAPAPAAAPAPKVRPVLVAAPVVLAPPKPVFDTLREDELFSSALARHGVGADDVSGIVKAMQGKLDKRGMRGLFQFSLDDKGACEVHTLTAEGIPRTLIAKHSGDAFSLTVSDAKVETRVEGASGAVKSSLYEAMLDEGEDANLVNKFVDVFAWNVDFYKQTREGDEWKVLVEKKYAGDRFLGYGKVVAAEYVNAGAVYRGFLFDSKDGKHSGTYDDEGQALLRPFLKAPMEITRVTSSYGMRFHPLGTGEQFHHGIDYGAPLGTPIWAVGDGVIEMAKL